MFFGVFNAYELDTTPGNPSSPFSPPGDWTGDEGNYLKFLRQSYKNSPVIRQRLGIAARAKKRNIKLTITGPYHQVLLETINKLQNTTTT